MRKKIRFIKTSYPVFSFVMLFCLWSVYAHGQMAYDADQVFLSGIAFCFPQANDVVTEITQLKRSFTGSTRFPNVLYPVNNKVDSNTIAAAALRVADSLYNAGIIETDSTETKEIAPVVTISPKIADKPLRENKQVNLDIALFDTETDMLVNKYAEMIGEDPGEVQNFPLYKFIDQWYGIKYKFGGTDNTGIDCSAFSQKLYSSIYSVPISRTARQQHKQCEIIKDSDNAMEGDLIFFRIHRLRVSHVGVYLANGYFVHASRSRGVTISNLSDRYWQRRYAGCGRVSKDNAPATESDYLQ